MRHAAALLAAFALAGPATAAPAKKPATDPKASADAFNLDLAPADGDATVTSSEPAAEAAPTATGGFTLDTPIGALLADYRSKAVLDKDMPGLSTDKNLDKFKPLSLNKLAPLSGGRLTPELLAKVGKHLAKIK